MLARPSSGYFERIDWRSRGFAFIATLAIYALVIAAFLINWHDPVAIRQAVEAPNVVTLLPLEESTPPKPTPPEPIPMLPTSETRRPSHRLEPTRPVAELPTIVRPATVMPTIGTPTIASVPAPSVTIPVQASPALIVAAVPSASPAPPVTRSSSGKSDSWESRVLGRLEAAKRYPVSARSRRDQGVTTVRFRLGRQGQLLSATLIKSSGSRMLDDEALAAVHRAVPFPPIPAQRPVEIELVVPIEFYLHAT